MCLCLRSYLFRGPLSRRQRLNEKRGRDGERDDAQGSRREPGSERGCSPTRPSRQWGKMSKLYSRRNRPKPDGHGRALRRCSFFRRCKKHPPARWRTPRVSRSSFDFVSGLDTRRDFAEVNFCLIRLVAGNIRVPMICFETMDPLSRNSEEHFESNEPRCKSLRMKRSVCRFPRIPSRPFAGLFLSRSLGTVRFVYVSARCIR